MKRLLVVAALLAAAFSGGAGRSQATFVAASNQADAPFASSGAFNGVAVSLEDPGTPLRSSVPLASTASSDRPLVSVTLQRAPAGSGAWTTICAPAAAPYGCSWATAGVADGLYDLRAVALDASGYSRTSTLSSRRVDNTAPAVSASAASPLVGAATVGATASDAGGSGVGSVAFDARPASGGAWTAICTDAGAPYSCAWNTAAVADGPWDVRATATDAAGNVSTSIAGNRVVDNTAPTVSMTDPGGPVGGTVTLGSTASDGAGTGVASVAYQYRTSPSGPWTAACTAATAPFSCGWATPATGLYDLRAIATDGTGRSTTSATLASRQVDNTAPSSATMADPGSPRAGSVTLTGTGVDAIAGMGAMRFEYRPSAGGTWATACTDDTAPSPFSCAWSTAGVPDGSYDLRSVAIDAAGNTRTSATIASRILDNTGPALSVAAPGMVRGTTTVTATASDPRGVVGVAIQRSPAGAGTWTTICADLSSPYSCPWTTSGLADGPYELRAVAADALGNVSTSAAVDAYVNNTGPTGLDVQGANGGVDNRLDQGDRVVFTYSEAIDPDSILAGWNGGAMAIRVRVNNAGSSDSMEFYDTADTTPLGLLAPGSALAIGIDHVRSATVFDATLARSGAAFTVTIGALVSGRVTSNPGGTSAMSWQTSSQARSLASGKPVMPATVIESGTADSDF